MEAIRATIRAAVPVRGIPKTAQQRPGKRLIEDDERRPGSWGPVFVFVMGSEEEKGPVGWRGHRASRSQCGWEGRPVWNGLVLLCLGREERRPKVEQGGVGTSTTQRKERRGHCLSFMLRILNRLVS